MRPIIRVVVLLQLLLTGAFLVPLASASQFVGTHSVTIEVSPEYVLPGGTVNVTIHMSTALDDSREVLDVSLPEEMNLLGTLMCSGACYGPGITPGTNDVTANFNVGSYDPNPQRFATLTFTASVSSDAMPGSSLVISAFLGSPSASDSVAVVVQEPPEQKLYLDVSPEGVVLGPDGAFVVFAYPYVPFTQGIPQEPITSYPELTITVMLPAGLTLDPDSECVQVGQSVQSATPICDISASSKEDGETEVSVVMPGSSQTAGVILRLRNESVKPMESSQISLHLQATTGTLGISNPITTLDVFALDSMVSIDASTEEAAMNVLVISDQYGCITPQSPEGSSLALAEWGGGPILSTTSTSNLVHDVEGLENLRRWCPRLVTFEGVPSHSLYLLGTSSPGMGDTFCRACILGTVPWAENGVPIITSDPYD